jgi:predicted Rdx family selenoprotein
LQTFSASIGEVALIPVTGGIFTVTMIYAPHSTLTTKISSTMLDKDLPSPEATSPPQVVEMTIWDRKVDNGFPETKELKNRVRNIIEPGRDLGHIDRSLKKKQAETDQQSEVPRTTVGTEEVKDSQNCEDCK